MLQKPVEHPDRSAVGAFEMDGEIARIWVNGAAASQDNGGGPVVVTTGSWFRRGALIRDRVAFLAVADPDDSSAPYPTVASVSSRHSDGSVEWLKLSWIESLPSNSCQRIVLFRDGHKKSLEDHHALDWQKGSLRFVPESFGLQVGSGAFDATLEAIVDEGDGHESVLRFEPAIRDDERSNALETIWSASASLRRRSGAVALVLSIDVTERHLLSQVDLEVRVHNPRAASHPGGLWDLGDPLSVFLERLVLRCSAEAFVSFTLDPGHGLPVQGGTSLHAMQLSSGPEDGRSNAHLDRHGAAPDLSCAARWRVGNRDWQDTRRIDPAVTLNTDAGPAMSVCRHRFSDEFPSSMHAVRGRLDVGLLDAGPAGATQELQPGESKRFRIDFAAVTGRGVALPPRALPILPEGGLCSVAGVAAGPEDPVDAALLELIEPPTVWFDKRRLGDEFGWRHFGEVFADHESRYLMKDQPPNVSHYNNQYDLVLGFAVQALRTHDPRWHELMDDLARHVVDIDLYDTREDRVEYNGGLFWHTNHYEDAKTSTHRTFSRRNQGPEGAPGDSGGPGMEHCYTTGLLLHHRLTGDVHSRRAVLTLANWMAACVDKDPSISGQLHAAIARWRDARRAGRRSGTGRVYRHRLRRDTANFVHALLDAHSLTGDVSWLERAGRVVFDTLGPDDDIDERGLCDVENNWSYTIMLQAVIRYVRRKAERREHDASATYARMALLHYARWMSIHESPYLNRPEILEFPNETWAAQDLRKHAVLSFAATCASDPSDRRAMLAAADRIGSAALSKLQESPHLSLARVQAIILQCAGAASACTGLGDLSQAVPATIPTSLPPTPPSSAARVARAFLRVDPRRELRWLRHRL